MNYQEADELLGQKNKKVLHRSPGREYPIVTWLERHDKHIGLWLVETKLLDYGPDGTIVLNSGGWQTHITKDRMNKHLPRPWCIWRQNGLWTLADYETRTEYPFSDGMTIKPDGAVEGVQSMEETKALLKQLNKYVTGYVNALAKGDVPAPSGGDCWMCLLKDAKTGEPFTGDTDHIMCHLDEKYYVPSLLANAIEANGLHDTMSQMALWWVQEKWYGHESLGASHPMFNRKDSLSEKQTRNCLKKYLKKQLGLPF